MIYRYEESFPKELCDDILNEYANSDLWSPSLTIDDVGDFRSCDNIFLSTMQEDHQKKLDKDIHNILSNMVLEYIEQVGPSDQLVIKSDSGYDLLRYKEGDYYQEHVDHHPDYVRSISCSVMLNDDYEGGRFSFWDDELSFKLKKAEVIFFPSNFMFPHQITEVTKGTRYSLVTWFA